MRPVKSMSPPSFGKDGIVSYISAPDDIPANGCVQSGLRFGG